MPPSNINSRPNVSQYSPLVKNAWYRLEDWRGHAAVRDVDLQLVGMRWTPFGGSRRTEKTRVADLTDNTLKGTDRLYLCLLDNVAQVDEFAANFAALNIDILVYHETDWDGVPFTNSIRLVRRPNGRVPDWYQALLLLNKWQNKTSYAQMEITDHPARLDVSWYQD